MGFAFGLIQSKDVLLEIVAAKIMLAILFLVLTELEAWFEGP
jgi:hypothetical protein